MNAGMQESDTLTGGSHLTTFEAPFGKIGLGICYDIVRAPLRAILLLLMEMYFSAFLRWR